MEKALTTSRFYAEQKLSEGHHARCNTWRGKTCDCYMTRPDYRLATEYLALSNDLELWMNEARELRLRAEQAERVLARCQERLKECEEART